MRASSIPLSSRARRIIAIMSQIFDRAPLVPLGPDALLQSRRPRVRHAPDPMAGICPWERCVPETLVVLVSAGIGGNFSMIAGVAVVSRSAAVMLTPPTPTPTMPEMPPCVSRFGCSVGDLRTVVLRRGCPCGLSGFDEAVA